MEMVNVLLFLIIAATVILAAPLFYYYMSIVLYDVFCIVWNVFAFIVNATRRR